MEQVSRQSQPTVCVVYNMKGFTYNSIVHSAKIIIHMMEKQVNIFVFIVHLYPKRAEYLFELIQIQHVNCCAS